MRVVDSIFLLHISSTGSIYCLFTGLEHSQQRPLERLSPQGVDDGVRAAVEDGDGVGKHAQQWVVGVQVDDLDLPPNHVGHVAHCQDEGHNGDGGPPPLIQFALKRNKACTWLREISALPLLSKRYKPFFSALYKY